MRDNTKLANPAVRILSDDEVLAVSGGRIEQIRGDGLGGLRRALGGGFLGQVVTEIVHTGRRAARDLPFQIF